MKKGLFAMALALICAMACMFGLVACNDEERTTAVESVTLNKTELTLEVGDEETLTATVAPDDAMDKTVTWTSDNTAIATVENGKVTAVAAGRATITAKAGDKTAACAVTVKEALTEGTDFDALVSDKVTEDEWKAAFSESSFANATIESLGQTIGYLKIQENIRYMSAKHEGYEDTIYGYFVEEGEQRFIYMSEDGESFIEYPEDEEMLDELYFSFKLLCPDFSLNYAEFTYDEESGAYVCDRTILSNPPLEKYDDFPYTNISIKIIDGKLAVIVCDRVEYDEHYEFHMYDYGKTEITPPAIIENNVA